MSGDTWLRAILVLICIAFALRAASAMCSDAARAWYERRADISRYNSGSAPSDRPYGASLPIPQKPWYVKLHEWGHW